MSIQATVQPDGYIYLTGEKLGAIRLYELDIVSDKVVKVLGWPNLHNAKSISMNFIPVYRQADLQKFFAELEPGTPILRVLPKEFIYLTQQVGAELRPKDWTLKLNDIYYPSVKIINQMIHNVKLDFKVSIRPEDAYISIKTAPVEEKSLEIKAPGSTSKLPGEENKGGGGSAGGKALRFLGGANTFMSIAAIPVMTMAMMEEDVIGWDCNDIEASLNTLRCQWESRLNPKNNTVICDLNQKEIQGENACGVTGIRFSFTVNDSESKDNLKNSSLMGKGLDVRQELQQDPAGMIQSMLTLFHIKTDGQIKYQPIQFTPVNSDKM